VIIMQGVLNATDVRKEWGSFIDTVVRLKPQFVKRNRDMFAALSLDHLELILSNYRFTMDYEQEEDGSYSGSLHQVDIVANAENLNSLKTELAKALVEYAHDYIDEFHLYYNSPNRKAHFPYLIHVLIQSDIDNIVKLIDHA
jgi:uncharacterized protein YbcC (UPF0753/DUF2309 family)